MVGVSSCRKLFDLIKANKTFTDIVLESVAYFANTSSRVAA
jgi:hypothetical protein